jgi:hypothetical protein
MPVEGYPSGLVRGLFQRHPRTFPDLDEDGHLREADVKWMSNYYARECGGVGWRWQAMDSKNCVAPLGGEQTGKNSTDRGKLGAKINLIVDERGAPISIALTGANRHDIRYPPSI